MESKSFSSVIRAHFFKLFGQEDIYELPGEEFEEKATKLLRAGFKRDAFLLTFTRSATDDLNAKILSAVTGCRFTDEIRTEMKAVSKKAIADILTNENSSFLEYEKIIQLCVVRSAEVSFFALIMAKGYMKHATPEQMKFVESILAFYTTSYSSHFLFWRLVYSVCEFYLATDAADETIFEYFLQEIIGYGHADLLTRFCKYYQYLGIKKVYEIMFRILMQNGMEESLVATAFMREENFFWAAQDFTMTVLTEKYKRIVKTLDGNESLSDIVAENSILSLVPYCLYASETGNAEIEAMLLWYALRRSPSPRLLERMSELSGREIPHEFVRLPLETRANWLTNRLKECLRAYNYDNPVWYKESVKKACAVQPFKIEILKVLLKIDGISEDPDITMILTSSITKMTSRYCLGKLLCYAIVSMSRTGVRLTLNRIILCGYYSTIAHTLEEVRHFTKMNDRQGELFLDTLNAYDEFIPKEYVNRQKSEKLREYIRTKASSNILFSEGEKNTLLATRGSMELLDKETYGKSFAQFKRRESLPVPELEMLLRSALVMKRKQDILELYAYLVSIDRATASFYNLQIEPYLLGQRISKEVKSFMNTNLVSKVWGRPVVLEHPVDKSALQATGYHKDAVVSKKKQRTTNK